MIEIGKKQKLRIEDEDPSGFYLVCTDNQEAFMPGTLAPKNAKIGEEVEVFIFIDSKDEEIATSQMPLAYPGEFAFLKVKDVAPQGVYLDIGLPKDLLVPGNLQKYEMKVGEIHLVKVLQEEETGRLYGSTKLGSYVETESINLKKKQTIQLSPYYRTPLGYKVLIENKFLGMVYHNEIFTEVEIGKLYEGTVKAIREDGLIDAFLQKTGLDSIEANEAKILNALEESGGKLELWDKSSPEDIKKRFGISKSTFKATLGSLYKKKLIELHRGYIQLAK